MIDQTGLETPAVIPPVSAPPVETREKINILLVDDHPGKLLAHEAILSELQENIVTASSGEQALECLLHNSFAIILLDVNMPGLDGFETAALIRQHPRFEQPPFCSSRRTTLPTSIA